MFIISILCAQDSMTAWNEKGPEIIAFDKVGPVSLEVGLARAKALY
jgi:hypothetical protein